ncbi:hypothetical protein WAI453_012431 [Rhynchosporium graminicola]
MPLPNIGFRHYGAYSSTSAEVGPCAPFWRKPSNTTTVATTIATTAHLPTLNDNVINPNNPENLFTKFPKLPLEIRRQCFREMVSPRIIEVLFSKNPNALKYEFLAEIPVILHICKDSRVEGLITYRLSFANKYALAPVFFCTKLDTISFRGPRLDGQLTNFLKTVPDKSLIRKMSLTYSTFWSQVFRLDIASALPLFTSLTEISFFKYLTVDRSCSGFTKHEGTCQVCSRTPNDRTVFLTQEEIEAHAPLLSYPLAYIKMSIAEAAGRHRYRSVPITHYLTPAQISLFGGPDEANFVHKGALIHKIDRDFLYARPMGRKVLATRSRSSREDKSKKRRVEEVAVDENSGQEKTRLKKTRRY